MTQLSLPHPTEFIKFNLFSDSFAISSENELSPLALLYGITRFVADIVRTPSPAMSKAGYLLDSLRSSPICFSIPSSTEITFLTNELLGQPISFSVAPQKWKQYVFDVQASTDVDYISETIGHAFDFLIQYGPKLLDLQNLNPEAVQGEHLAALLRATSSFQSDVPGWFSAVAVAEIALKREGVDPDAALLGLK